MQLEASTSEPFIMPLSGLTEVVRSIVEPVIQDKGCELVALKTSRGQNHSLVQVFVDQDGKDKGITLEELESLNRLIGDILDVEDGDRTLFNGRYTLEISSPGLERPLTKKSHFSWAKGQDIKVRILDAGKKTTFEGKLLNVAHDGFELMENNHDLSGESRFISWQTVQKANLVFSFESKNNNKESAQKKRKKNNADKAASRAGGNPKKPQKRRQDI